MFLPLRSCTANRLDENGRPTAATGRSNVCKYARSQVLVPAFFDHLEQSAFDIGERSCRRRAAWIDHNVPLRADFGAVKPKRFTNPAFDPVADHRAANRARHGETDPGAIAVIPRKAERREDWTGNPSAVVIDNTKIRGSEDPRRSRKREAISQTGQLFRR